MGIARASVRRSAVAAVSLAAGAIVAVGTAAPASAETLNGSCESGEICLYYLSGYSGYIADMNDEVPNYSGWHFYKSSAWLNDNTRSGKSRAVFWCAKLYEHSNYGGTWRHFTPGQSVSDFGWMNDRGSSHDWILC